MTTIHSGPYSQPWRCQAASRCRSQCNQIQRSQPGDLAVTTPIEEKKEPPAASRQGLRSRVRSGLQSVLSSEVRDPAAVISSGAHQRHSLYLQQPSTPLQRTVRCENCVLFSICARLRKYICRCENAFIVAKTFTNYIIGHWVDRNTVCRHRSN